MCALCSCLHSQHFLFTYKLQAPQCRLWLKLEVVCILIVERITIFKKLTVVYEFNYFSFYQLTLQALFSHQGYKNTLPSDLPNMHREFHNNRSRLWQQKLARKFYILIRERFIRLLNILRTQVLMYLYISMQILCSVNSLCYAQKIFRESQVFR